MVGMNTYAFRLPILGLYILQTLNFAVWRPPLSQRMRYFHKESCAKAIYSLLIGFIKER